MDGTTKRLRSGGRVPKETVVPRYMGQQIEEGLIRAGRVEGASRTQGRILLAAIALFAERGYENCSLRAIASAVGVKAPTIYNYYESKEAILVDAIDFGMNDFFSYVLDGIQDTPREERLFEIVRRHLRYKLEHRVIARANDRLIDPQFGNVFVPREYQKKFNKRLLDYRYLIHELVAEKIGPDSAVDTMVITLAIMNHWDRSAYWYNPAGKLSLEQILEQLVLITCRIMGIERNI